MKEKERFEAIKVWYNKLKSNYRLNDWACIDPDHFEELHKILYHIDFTVEGELK